jgi:Protein of unknown function (DUF2795)
MTAYLAETPAEALDRADLERDDGPSDIHPIVDVIRRTTPFERQVRTSRAGAATMNMRLRLQQVLADQTFPAARWELIAAAETYGADLVTRSDLQALPPVRFNSLAEVLFAAEGTGRAGR